MKPVHTTAFVMFLDAQIRLDPRDQLGRYRTIREVTGSYGKISEHYLIYNTPQVQVVVRVPTVLFLAAIYGKIKEDKRRLTVYH